MSGDNLYGAQSLKFFSEEMNETQKIELAHFEKKLFPESNSIIHLPLKQQEIKSPEMAWKVSDTA